jgi:hypothetical protein
MCITFYWNNFWQRGLGLRGGGVHFPAPLDTVSAVPHELLSLSVSTERYFVPALCVLWLIVRLRYLRDDNSGDVQLKLVIIHCFKIIHPERCMNQWHRDVTPVRSRCRLVTKYRTSEKSLCWNKEMRKCDWCQFLCATVLLLTWGGGGSILSAGSLLHCRRLIMVRPVSTADLPGLFKLNTLRFGDTICLVCFQTCFFHIIIINN